MRILYLATTGASDPTKASIPLHIAANGSVEAGQECAVVLDGDELHRVLEALERLRARFGDWEADAAVEALAADEDLAAVGERADARRHVHALARVVVVVFVERPAGV